MGRRRRKRYKKMGQQRRRLPKVFQCPACGLPNLVIDVEEYTVSEGDESFTRKRAVIKCLNPSCGLRATMEDIPPILDAVDIYSKFLDKFTSGEIEVTYETSEEEGVEESAE